MLMRIVCYLILLAPTVAVASLSFAGDSPLASPDGFTFSGTWNCSGHFIRSGKVHRSTYEGKGMAGDAWIELIETDIEPKGYVGHYLIGYDTGKKQIIELDANNAGYAIYTSPGWHDRSLTLTSTGSGSYSGPSNRFVFETKSADAFSVVWETNSDSQWVASDQLNCQRENEGKDEQSSSLYLQPHAQAGQKFSNVFSRTIAFRADGFDDVVKRVSGTADYLVRESSSEKLVAEVTALYDGRPEAKGTAEIKEQGRVSCWDGTCAAATDASGLAYSAAVWGSPPKSLRKGTSWEVVIERPWELGPAGTETVTVLSVDPTEHSVILEREGSGEGHIEGDGKPVQLTKEGKTYAADVNPGRSHWKGYTTFREGIVISDELLLERTVTMSSKEIGSVAGTQREYILLNAMPSS
jgi:hypothetical protein